MVACWWLVSHLAALYSRQRCKWSLIQAGPFPSDPGPVLPFTKCTAFISSFLSFVRCSLQPGAPPSPSPDWGVTSFIISLSCRAPFFYRLTLFFFCPLFVSSFFLPSFLKTKLGCGGRLYCPIVEVKERKDCEDEKYERGIGFEWFTLPELASWNRIKMIGTHIRQKDHQKVPFCLLFLWIDLEAWTIPLMVDLLWYSDSTVDSVVKSENTTI